MGAINRPRETIGNAISINIRGSRIYRANQIISALNRSCWTDADAWSCWRGIANRDRFNHRSTEVGLIKGFHRDGNKFVFLVETDIQRITRASLHCDSSDRPSVFKTETIPI